MPKQYHISKLDMTFSMYVEHWHGVFPKQGDMGPPGTPGIPGLNGLTGRKVNTQTFSFSLPQTYANVLVFFSFVFFLMSNVRVTRGKGGSMVPMVSQEWREKRWVNYHYSSVQNPTNFTTDYVLVTILISFISMKDYCTLYCVLLYDFLII